MTISNRKTHKTLELSAARTPMAKKVGMFAVTYRSPVTEIIEYVESQLPYGLSPKDKNELFNLIRVAFTANEKELGQVLENPATLLGPFIDKMMLKQSANAQSSDTSELMSAGQTIVSAKVNAMAPGLLTVAGILLGSINAAAALPYEYVPGQPVGGKDLCAGSIYKCIQGHLQEMGIWNSTLPQSASEFVSNVTETVPCVTQQTLGELTKRAFFAPTNNAVDCNIMQRVDAASSLSFKVTALDQIGCNIAKDSAVGAAKKCAQNTPNQGDLSFGLSVGLGIGVPVLALSAFIIAMALKRNQKKQGEQMRLVNE